MPIAPDILAGVARRLAAHAGLELPSWVVESRAQARITASGLRAHEYLALIESPRGADELAELVELVRVGETRFFRHRSQVDALIELLPRSLEARGRRAVRAWSAGCATGEEPYTLAIVLSRLLPGFEVSILATDVSADALAIARAGVYPAAEVARVPAPYRDDFVIEGEVARVRPEIAARVRFEQANLADAERRRGFDLVWCRNVLIYFEAAARKRAIERLIGALEPGGFLFVGYSESLRDVAELESVRTEEAVVYVRRSARAPGRITRTPPIGVTVTPVAAPPPAPSSDRRLALRSPCDPAELTRALAALLAAPGVHRLTVELDEADEIPDEVAPILRRARAAAGAAGLELVLLATRAGAKRWLRRHRLEDLP